MRLALSLLLSTVFLMGLSPTPSAPDAQDVQTSPSKAVRAANKKLQARMQGAWRLVELQLVEEGKQGFGSLQLEHTGYCLVSGTYLSIEFHFRLVDKDQRDWGHSLVSGLHRFDLEGGASMETATVIATGTRQDGSPAFEAPGTKRRYDVTFAGERMILVRDDGHRLVFERLGDDRRRFDIFGRPVREEDDASGEGDGDGAGSEEEGGSGRERKKDGGL